jgi:hypothetical protein
MPTHTEEERRRAAAAGDPSTAPLIGNLPPGVHPDLFSPGSIVGGVLVPESTATAPGDPLPTGTKSLTDLLSGLGINGTGSSTRMRTTVREAEAGTPGVLGFGNQPIFGGPGGIETGLSGGGPFQQFDIEFNRELAARIGQRLGFDFQRDLDLITERAFRGALSARDFNTIRSAEFRLQQEIRRLGLMATTSEAGVFDPVVENMLLAAENELEYLTSFRERMQFFQDRFESSQKQEEAASQLQAQQSQVGSVLQGLFPNISLEGIGQVPTELLSQIIPGLISQRETRIRDERKETTRVREQLEATALAQALFPNFNLAGIAIEPSDLPLLVEAALLRFQEEQAVRQPVSAPVIRFR